jgi:excisionase family DNA binding protein
VTEDILGSEMPLMALQLPAPPRFAGAPQLVNIDELARHLDVPVRHVRRLVSERGIPFLKWGRLLRFDVREVVAWLGTVRTTRGEDGPDGEAPMPAAGDPTPVAGGSRRPQRVPQGDGWPDPQLDSVVLVAGDRQLSFGTAPARAVPASRLSENTHPLSLSRRRTTTTSPDPGRKRTDGRKEDGIHRSLRSSRHQESPRKSALTRHEGGRFPVSHTTYLDQVFRVPLCKGASPPNDLLTTGEP